MGPKLRFWLLSEFFGLLLGHFRVVLDG
jgi:hypothetical protein